jgi:hypothetical protein
MKVSKIFSGPLRGSTEAVVLVGVGEIADIEEMVDLVHGEKSHFGFYASLIKVGYPEPEYKDKNIGSTAEGLFETFDPSLEVLHGVPDKSEVRFYRVRVEHN